MDEKLMESYLDNVAELVIDEDKIVTYKSLSKSLGLHVNTAKQLLHKFLTKHKLINSFPISATYLLGGKLPNGGLNIIIVNEIDLDSTRLKFKEITLEHVYSIQKGYSIKDVKVLCGIDKGPSKIKSPLVIKCSKSILKSKGEVKKKTNSCQETDRRVIEEALAPSKVTVKTVEVNNKSKDYVNKDFLAKTTANKSPEKNSAKTQADAKKPVGSIASLFANAHKRNASKSTIQHKYASEDQLNEIETAGASEIEKVENKKERKETNIKTDMNSLQKSNEKTVKKKKSGDKRRRIQMCSDSENSESDNEETPLAEEASSLCTANIENEKEEVKEFSQRSKRKKRKVIDRTVMNEDGYLETKKEITFESDSENDLEEEKNASSEQKKVKVAPASDKGKGVQAANIPKKQSSLFAFFKKN